MDSNVTASNRLPTLVYATDVIQSVFSVILLVGNVAVMSNLCGRKKKRHSTYYFLSNICVSDFIVGVALGQRSLLELAGINVDALCQANCVLLVLGCGSSVCNLLFYNADNFISIKRITQLSANMSIKICRRLTVANWIVWTVMSLGSLVSILPHRSATDHCLLSMHTHRREYLWLLVSAGIAAATTLMVLYAGLLHLLKSGIFRPCEQRFLQRVDEHGTRPPLSRSVTMQTLQKMTQSRRNTQPIRRISAIPEGYRRPTIFRQSRTSRVDPVSANGIWTTPHHTLTTLSKVTDSTDQRSSVTSNTTSLVYRTSCFNQPSGLADSVLQSRLLYCRRLYYLVSFIVLCYVLLWLPVLGAAVYSMLHSPTPPASIIITSCLCLNCTLNITLFWVRDKKFRETFSQLSFPCCK